MKKAAFVFASFIAFAPLTPAYAQSAADAAVDEFMQNVKVEYLFDTMMDQLMVGLKPILFTTLKAQLEQAGLTLPDETIEQIITAYAVEFTAFQPEFLDLVRDIYLEEYSVEELQSLNQLYKTDPVFRKFIDKAPGIAIRSSKAGEEIGQKYGELAMQKAIQKVLAQ